MLTRFRSENRKPGWGRFVTCAVLVLYLFAFVVMPVLHERWHSGFTSVSSLVSGDSCPLCKFVRVAVPFFASPELFEWQSETVAQAFSIISIPSVADAIALPLCRAPPVF
jgi:hypothetical protein